MRRNWLLLGIALLVAVLAIGAVACSDDDDDDNGDAIPEATEMIDDEPEATAEVPDAGNGDADPEATAEVPDAGNGDADPEATAEAPEDGNGDE